MAIDKAVDSGALDSGLTSIANAIRTKGGTSASLAFPAGFVSAVQAIPSGGGTPSWDDLLSFTSPYDNPVVLNNMTTIDRSYMFYFVKNVSIHLSNLTTTTVTYALACGTSSLHIPALVAPKLATTSNDLFRGSYIDIIDLGPDYKQIKVRALYGGAYGTLILRSSTLVSLENTNGLNTNPTTIYIPKVLYDALGTGGASDYLAATNWSSKGYTASKFACIEGSVYENAYADGTPIT